MTRSTGSMGFVAVHPAFYGTWILVNLGVLPGLPVSDPSCVALAMVASVEAISSRTSYSSARNARNGRG